VLRTRSSGPTGRTERRGGDDFGLAPYRPRVRSSEVLDRSGFRVRASNASEVTSPASDEAASSQHSSE